MSTARKAFIAQAVEARQAGRQLDGTPDERFPSRAPESATRRLEKQIVRRFVTDALAAGKRLAVSLERGFDLKEMLLGSRDVGAIMAEAFAGDEAHIFVQPGEGPTIEDGQVASEGWVYIVLGNEGWDVISDYTTNLETLLAGATKLAEAAEEG